MAEARPTFTIRILVFAVAFVAVSIGWSAHWSDCKYQAVLHATLANSERQQRPGESLEDQTRKQRNAQWHEEMRRKFDRAAWLPWPGSTAEPPRP
jgi:hypothetical protein